MICNRHRKHEADGTEALTAETLKIGRGEMEGQTGPAWPEASTRALLLIADRIDVCTARLVELGWALEALRVPNLPGVCLECTDEGSRGDAEDCVPPRGQEAGSAANGAAAEDGS